MKAITKHLGDPITHAWGGRKHNI